MKHAELQVMQFNIYKVCAGVHLSTKYSLSYELELSPLSPVQEFYCYKNHWRYAIEIYLITCSE